MIKLKCVLVLMSICWLLSIKSDDVVYDTNRVSYLKLSNLIDVKFNPQYSHSLLVSAIIQVESKGNPKAVSHRGAMGLMQIMPEIAYKFEVKNPFNPDENVKAGKRLFREELQRFNGDIFLALAAYNAGSPRITKAIKKAGSRRYWDIYPHLPKETQNYIPKIIKEVMILTINSYTIKLKKGNV